MHRWSCSMTVMEMTEAGEVCNDNSGNNGDDDGYDEVQVLVRS